MMCLVSDIFRVGIILLMNFLGSYLQRSMVASYNDIDGVLMSVYCSWDMLSIYADCVVQVIFCKYRYGNNEWTVLS